MCPLGVASSIVGMYCVALLLATSGILDSYREFLRLPAEEQAFRIELARFPSEARCQESINNGEAHLTWIEWKIALHPYDRLHWQLYHWQIREWLAVWRSLLYAHWYRPPYALSLSGRRGHMAFVRQAIGELNYRDGYVYPPIAPCFREGRDGQ